MPEKLNHINYMNVGAFALSWVLNSGVADGPRDEYWSLNFLSGMDELARRYESLVTPASVTFFIAHLILLLEGVFTIAQMMPNYRATVMVQEGVKFWFLFSAVAQFCWSLDFNVENIVGSILSSIFMGIMFYSLSRILMAQASLTEAQNGEQTAEEFWLLRFPFSVHCGWVFAVFVMSINAWFVQLEVPDIILFILGVLSLIGFAAVGFKMLYANGEHPNYVIPSILAWFVFGIALTADKGRGGEMEGALGIIFNALSLILAITLSVNIAYLFYTKEYNADEKQVEGPSEGGETAYVNAGSLA